MRMYDIVRAGDLRHRVTLQKPVYSQDEFGQPENNWEDIVTVWAKIEDISGREYFIAQQAPTAQVSTRIIVRWRSGVRPEMRIVHKDRIFDIKAAFDPESRKRWLHVMCQEVF